jgi:TolB protein
MRRRAQSLAGSLLFSIVACTGGEVAEPATTAPPTTITGTPRSAPVGDLPGRLVVLDEAGNVVTIAPDGSDPIAITDDAGRDAAYRQPTFSPVDDLVSWAEVQASGFGLGFSDGSGKDRTLTEMIAPPFFTYWSPDGTNVGALHNTEQGTSIQLEVVDMATRSARVLTTGSPLYFSWSPDGTRLAVHVELELFATLDLEGNSQSLGETAPGYQAPDWLPEGILHLAAEGLELRPIQGEPRVLATVPGPIAFVANPQGSMVAVQAFVADSAPGVDVAFHPAPALPANRVVVIDIATGEIDEVSTAPSIGLFWSPDGNSLLVLTAASGGGAELETLVWHDGEITELSVIAPHPALIQQVLRFFDQYGQSLQLWSPDSTAFALVGAIEDDPGIWIYTIDGSDPVLVHEGSWVSWSSG